MFRAKRNRRRADAAKTTGEIKATAKQVGPVVFKLLGLLVVSVACVFGAREGWTWATSSPWLALSEVTVEGEVEASQAELVRLGNVTLGHNLLLIDTAAMERAIATHPWVKTVNVRRHPPARLSIEVEEHRAVALLSLGELYLVNEAGEPFKRVVPQDKANFPLVTGLDRDAFAAHRQDALASLRDALKLIDAYGAHSVSQKEQALSEVHLHPEGVLATTLGGQQIEFGEGDVLPKLERLARVQKELRARSMVAEVIHLDNRARPSWVAVQLAASKP